MLERDAHRPRGPQRAVGQRLLQDLLVVLDVGRVALQQHVGVAVDEARRDREPRGVHHLSAGRDCVTHRLDPAVLDDDHRPGPDLLADRVQQPAGLHRDDRRLLLSERDAAQERCHARHDPHETPPLPRREGGGVWHARATRSLANALAEATRPAVAQRWRRTSRAALSLSPRDSSPSSDRCWRGDVARDPGRRHEPGLVHELQQTLRRDAREAEERGELGVVPGEAPRRLVARGAEHVPAFVSTEGKQPAQESVLHPTPQPFPPRGRW